MSHLTESQLYIPFSGVSNTNPWTHPDLTVVGTLKVQSNVLNIGNTPPPYTALAYVTAAPTAAVVSAVAKVAYPSDLQGVILYDPSTGDGYALRGTSSLRLYPIVDGEMNTSDPLTFGSTTLVDNDDYEIAFDGSTITCYKNDVSIFTFSATGTYHPGWLYNVDNVSAGGAKAIGFTWTNAISGLTIDELTSPLHSTEPATALVTSLNIVPTTANTTITVTNDLSLVTTPTAVISLGEDAYQIEFDVPDVSAVGTGPAFSEDCTVTIFVELDEASTSPITLEPASGKAYVNASSVPGAFDVLSGELEIGDQIVYDTLEGTIEVTSNLAIIYTGSNPSGLSFEAQAWHASDSIWGEPALQSFEDNNPPIPSTNLDKRFLMDFLYPSASAAKSLGYQQITDLSAAVGLTIPEGTCFVLFKPTGQAIRFRDDGTNPTASVGYPVAVGYEYVYTGSAPSRIRLIEVTAGAVLDVLYYGK